MEYAERRRNYGILFIFSLFCEYTDLGYVRVPVIYRVNPWAATVVSALSRGTWTYVLNMWSEE